MQEKSFGNFNSWLPSDYKFEIIPCPYEETTTYGKGTSSGPDAIIEASQEVEHFDDECGINASKAVGIKTLAPVHMGMQDNHTQEPFKTIQELCADVYKRGKFPIVLGGEHSLSLGPVRAAYEQLKAQGKNLTLLHFDAHSDLRSEFEGNIHNHACAIYQIYTHCPGLKIVSVGIRNTSEMECDWLKESRLYDALPLGLVPENTAGKDDSIKIFFAKDEAKNVYNPEQARKTQGTRAAWTQADVTDALRAFGNDDVYITFDVDGFDSALMPSTGTPEPGGLDWYTPINIIRETTKAFNLVGADIVELAPIPGVHAADFLTAKLVYKIINYKSIAAGWHKSKNKQEPAMMV
jgi:agmatinase